MGVVDRYVIRQVIWPAFLGLLVFISLLIIPAVLVLARELVPKAVPAIQILKLVGYLLPSFLGIAIPMALLLGLLIGFGRMSSDREFVALQACGISVTRLLRPVAAVASVAFAATLYILLVALGDANQASREITFQILVDRAEGEVKPRVFFDKFTDLVLYVREMPPSGGWKDVFMVDSRPGQPQAVYVAERGRVNIDRNRKVVDMVLENAQRHVADANGEYRVERVAQSIISLNPEAIFPSVGPSKGEREMSIVELREHIAQLESEHLPTQSAWIEIYKKFSIPSACLVLGLIGLALGVNNRRDGRLSSFVIGLVVIFVYYAMLEGGSNFAKGRFIPTWLAVWAPNILFGVIGIWMFLRQLRGPGTPSRFTAWLQRTIVASIAKRAGTMRASGVSRILSVRIPFMGLLDRYVTLLYLRILALAFFGLLGIFYLSAFIDLSDEVLRGDAAWSQLFSHLYYASPQNVYYVLPMAVLLSTLVTIGLLTKNSELVVMKACGLSLYRVAAPLVLMALVTAVILVGVQERVLGQANHRAEAIRHVIRGGSPETFDVLKRRWVVGTNGAVYNYMYFNPASGVLDGLSIYRFDKDMRRITSRVYAEQAIPTGPKESPTWAAQRGWMREFSPDSKPADFREFQRTELSIEPVSYFSTEDPNADFMNYAQLRDYIERLRNGGLDVTMQRVSLEQKLAFPLVTLIMTLIAVPFAVTTGPRGAMYGIGAGLVLAFGYWGALTTFGALGAAGLFNPVVAAWAPNMLFGTAAIYLILTART